MHRRLFVTGLLGVAGTAAFAAFMPHEAEAAFDEDLASDANILPTAENLQEELDDGNEVEEGQQLAWHEGYPHGRRRRRRRRRGWRRICRREWWNGVYRRRCRRRPHWIWITIG
jgi:hypothetical protein